MKEPAENFSQQVLLIPSVPDTLGIVNSKSARALDFEERLSVDGRSARWDAHRTQRRRELIRSARKAVHQLGPDASMEEIAGTAGTSKSVFYRYFGDKSGLQQAVGEVVIGKMQSAVLSAVQTASTPRDGLKNMVLAYLTMAETSPNVYVFATQSSAEGDAASVRVTQDVVHATGALGSFFDAITGMIASPLGEGLGSPESAMYQFWPTAAIGLVRTAGEQWLASPISTRPSADEMAEHITAWLYNGVAHATQGTKNRTSTTDHPSTTDK